MAHDENEKGVRSSAVRVNGRTIDTPEWAGIEQRVEGYREALRIYVEAVNRGDVERLVALFAEDAVIEDPYGGIRHNICGRKDIRAFYQFVVPKTRLELLVVTGSGGNAAAMALRAHVGTDVLNNISVAQFDTAGSIIRYTTYWGPNDRRPSESSV
ncbi:MAG: nuclear transport factor 2 family protein [Steroidobacteraceae bacterium]